MKQLNITRIFIAMFLIITGTTVLAHDIAVTNTNGKTIYYKWMNNKTELAVSYRGSSYLEYSNEYFGYVIIPESVTYNGVSYPVTSIDNVAFIECPDLTNITIPNSVKKIGDWAFINCSGLTSLTIPKSVTSLGSIAFSGCSGLTSINVDLLNTKYDSRDNCNAIIETASNTLLFGCQNTIIPNSVTIIGGSAYHSCSTLTSVTIPNSVTIIDHDAFQATSLTSVTIPNSVKSIGIGAFCNCLDLSYITIGNGVNSIGKAAFQNIPKLTEVYCYAENIPTTESDAFKDSPINTATLHVPAASVDTYKNTAPWSEFGNIVAIAPPKKCATPTMSFANGKLMFDCETEGVEFVPSVSLVDMQDNSQLELLSVYRFSVYAKKEGYVDSDALAVNIDLNKLNGDINHDGQYTIADAVAIVNNILNDKTIIDPLPKFYYSVGTEAVTTTNYTTVNNAHYKLSLSDIPETLDLSSISQQQVYILLPEGCMPIIRNAQGLVATNSVSLGNGYMVYTTTTAINGAECTCTVLK